MQHLSQILIHSLSYTLPTGNEIFKELNFAFSKQKIGLVGRNGVGKSTLIKFMIGELRPNSGSIQISGTVAYVPQNPIFPSDITVAGLLGFETKLHAFQRISAGSVDLRDFEILNEDWNVAERLQQQLVLFGLNAISYDCPIILLSGGEMTRLLLTKAFFSDADFLLLDEPTNHLDHSARKQLYRAIAQWHGGLLVASHDRELLNGMDEIIELTTLGATSFGGNYAFYVEQKAIEKAAKEQQLNDAQKFMQKSKMTIQSSREKHEQKQSYGRELRKSGSIDKMSANSKKGRSERTQSKLLIKEERLLNQASNELQSAKEKVEITDDIHVELPATKVHNGKLILNLENLDFSYSNVSRPIISNFNLSIYGPERIALVGDNGSGKTTLVNLLLGKLKPTAGRIFVGTEYVSYLDQNATLLNPEISVLENFLQLNPDAKEHDAYCCLAAFLFKNVSALKLVKELSGGERLRALLACVLLSKHPPQLLILDEPTNHLDLNSIASIESALSHYQGAMIVISHDHQFLKNIGIKKMVCAPFTID